VVDEQGRLVGVVSAGAKEAQLVTTFIDVSEVRSFAQEVDETLDPRTAEQFVRRGDQYRARGVFAKAQEDFKMLGVSLKTFDDSRTQAENQNQSRGRDDRDARRTRGQRRPPQPDMGLAGLGLNQGN
jgi:hypothetical protein